MPYKSEAQRKYFNANREKLEAEGVDVDEWNESSKGKKLPEKAEKRAYGYEDEYGYIERVPWLNSQSRTEVLERMAKAQKLAKKQKLALTYETSKWGRRRFIAGRRLQDGRSSTRLRFYWRIRIRQHG